MTSPPLEKQIAADYFDGVTSRRQPVQMALGQDGVLRLHGVEPPRAIPLGQLRIEPRVGDMPRMVRLPGGGLLQTPANDAVDAWLRQQRQGWGQRLPYRLESRLSFVLAALLLAVGFTWGMVERGVPWLAQRTAQAIPAGMEATLGQRGLELLEEGGILTPSTLPLGERERVSRLFRSLGATLPGDLPFSLALRQSRELGANALALPSGIIVVTDALVRRLPDDQELLAVLAHESGHVVGRHTLRQLLQNSAATLLLLAWTGDVQSFSTLVSGLPALLMHLNYSREFEREADHFAVALLRQRRIPPGRLATALERLRDEGEGRTNPYLSTHPGLEERMEVIQGRSSLATSPAP